MNERGVSCEEETLQALQKVNKNPLMCIKSIFCEHITIKWYANINIKLEIYFV